MTALLAVVAEMDRAHYRRFTTPETLAVERELLQEARVEMEWRAAGGSPKRWPSIENPVEWQSRSLAFWESL